MGKVIGFPNKTLGQDAQVTYLRSYLQSNIIQLTKFRAELVKLRDDVARMKRAQLRVVPNGNDTPAGKK